MMRKTKYNVCAGAILLACLLSLNITSVRAQQAMSGAGGTSANANGQVSYTVGQIVYKTFRETGGSVAEGVQQIRLAKGGLPVNLVSFDATFRKNEGVLLSWETTAELNNDHFTIQRSTDGKTFEELAKMKGKDDSKRLVKYQFTDFYPFAGKSYYRLKQTDKDGSFSYSRIRAVVINDLPNYLSVYPNPTSDYLTVDANGLKSENLTFRIADVSGKLLDERPLTDKKSRIDIRNLQTGMYMISIFHNNSTVRTLKVIKN